MILPAYVSLSRMNRLSITPALLIAAAALLGVPRLPAAEDASARPAIVKPDARKLFPFDPRVIHTAQNARLVLGAPAKHEANPLFLADKPWENSMNNLYPNVLWDEDEQLFKLWYKCVLADKDAIARMDGPSTVHDVGWYLLHATSRDGIRWEKPALGLHKFDGDARTNIVARDCPNVGVFKDDHDPDPARRYKMVSDVGLGKPRARFSADGIHWGPATSVAGFGAQNGDTHNNAQWDPQLGKYLWFTKLYLGERTVARFESDDFLNWKNTGMVLRSTVEEGRASQTYCMTPFRLGNLWLAYVMLYHPGRDRSVDCELAWSPDSLHWERLAPGRPFIPRGEKGAYDSECIYAMAGPPVERGGKMLIYYGGDDFPHTGWKRHCLPCLATVERDRFAGSEPADAARPATLFTRQLLATSDPVRISADAAGGTVRIVALDDVAVGIDEAETVTGSVTDFTLRWKKGGLERHAGRRIHLQIELTNARLWSLSGLELTQQSLPPVLNPLKSPHRAPKPAVTRTVSFDASAEGWKGVDRIEHHSAGGAQGGFVHLSRAGRALPIASSGALPLESPLAGSWPEIIGGRGAAIRCQVRAAKPGGKVQIEIFARDIAQWHFEATTSFGPEWTTATAVLRYDWSDDEAAKAGWRRAANAFSWADTVQNVGKLVIVPTAAGALDAFDLDEVTVAGE